MEGLYLEFAPGVGLVPRRSCCWQSWPPASCMCGVRTSGSKLRQSQNR